MGHSNSLLADFEGEQRLYPLPKGGELEPLGSFALRPLREHQWLENRLARRIDLEVEVAHRSLMDLEKHSTRHERLISELRSRTARIGRTTTFMSGILVGTIASMTGFGLSVLVANAVPAVWLIVVLAIVAASAGASTLVYYGITRCDSILRKSLAFAAAMLICYEAYLLLAAL